MLYWALLFLVVAIVAGMFAFAGIAAAAAGIAKLLFVIFLVLFAIAMISHLGRRGSSGFGIDVGVPPKGSPFPFPTEKDCQRGNGNVRRLAFRATPAARGLERNRVGR